MGPGVKVVLVLAVLSAAAAVAGCVLTWGLTPERRRAERRRWLIEWSVKGLVVPLIIWALMNVGLSWRLQPFMAQVQAAQNSGGGWLMVYLRVVAAGLFVVSTYWTAVTLGWVLAEAGGAAEGETRAMFRSLCATCGIAMAVPALLVLWFGGWTLAGLAGIAVLSPIAGYGASVLHTKKVPPMYARAVARMKFGKYSEAEWEIIRELEKCEDDFEGWMMLAELYANQFNDLHEAEQTVLEICDQPKTTASQLSVALHRLADWHLERGGDPGAARRALQMIRDRLPGTHLAHMAGLRMNQLPGSAAELRQQQDGGRIPLPALGDSMDEAPARAESDMERKQAAEEANGCVEVLQRDPNNVPARERLARLFAERLDQAERGIEQANLLLEMPDQPEARRAEWLGLIAAWQIRHLQDAEAGRKTLERLIQEYPESIQAFGARRRLQLLEAGGREKSSGEG